MDTNEANEIHTGRSASLRSIFQWRMYKNPTSQLKPLKQVLEQFCLQTK